MMKKIGLIIFCLLSINCFAQNTKEQLANQYFRNGEFEKSADLYESLHQSNPQNNFYYTSLIKSLVNTSNYDKAEKIIRRQLKRSGNYPPFRVDLGNILELKGDKDKANKEYDAAIKALVPDMMLISEMASNFQSAGQTKYALKTYLDSRKLLGDPTAFSAEVSKIYSLSNNKQGIIDEQLNLLNEDRMMLQNTQNSLQDYLTEDADMDLLKATLLRRLQNAPDNISYAELLVWTLLQQKQFEGALIQVVALDNRLEEKGSRIMNFASFCRSNKEYDVAVKAYRKVIEKGTTSPFYQQARIELLTTGNEKITNSVYSQSELLTLESDYEKYLKEYGHDTRSAQTMRELGNLKAEYLQKPAEGARLLEEIIEKNLGNRLFIASCKLDLGDVYLLEGDIWEAALMYGQVDAAFKDEPIGQMAKYKNARLSYYTGEFDWAKAQLDVLKASTTQLIANDALNLSLVIADNTGLDTTTDALQLYASADLLIIQHRYAEAEKKLDSINLLYPGHELRDEILWSKANISLKKNELKNALDYLHQIATDFREDIWADDAVFLSAEIYENKLNDSKTAMEFYKKIIDEFPGSLYVVEARKRYRQLRGDAL